MGFSEKIKVVQGLFGISSFSGTNPLINSYGILDSRYCGASSNTSPSYYGVDVQSNPYSGGAYYDLSIAPYSDTLLCAAPVYNSSGTLLYYLSYWYSRYENRIQIKQRAITDLTNINSIYPPFNMYYTYMSISDLAPVNAPSGKFCVKAFYDADNTGAIGVWVFLQTTGGARYGACVYTTKSIIESFSGVVNTELSSDEFGTPSVAGGYTGGTFDDSSDTISLPNTPSMGVTSAGFVNVYNPTAGELANLGSELFPDLSFTTETPVSGSAGVTEAIEAAANALVNFGNQIPKIVDMYINSNLIQYVIDCHILPVAPTTSGTGNVKVGFKTFTPAPALVTSDYVDFDCGSLNIGEYYANFIDYAPYTKCKLFLPFVGFVDLQPEYWQSGTIKVVYRFNIIDGSFMAFVISTSSKSKLSNSVIAQYGGNACVHIPITGLNYSSMVSGVVSGAQAVISAQSGVQAATRAVNSAVDVMNAKPPVQQSNSYNATTSFLGVRTPYLLIERSVSNFSVNYTDEKGVPSNISTSFSGLSGYTEAASVHLDGITGATSEELTEISELLARGVIL